MSLKSESFMRDFVDIQSIQPYKTRWMNQFQGCLWRAWHSIVKEPAMIKIRIVQNIVKKKFVSNFFG